MNMPKASQTQNITDVRSQIDAIDAQLAALIVQRCDLSSAVSAAKRGAGDTAFGWRPAREIDIMRNLLRDQASLSPELAFCVWRALISFNLACQGDLTIYALDSTEQAAKVAFSVGVAPQVLPNAKFVFEALCKDDHAIGVLPWPDSSNWWVTMMEPAFAALRVCAASPIAGGGPEVMLVAARAPEPAGDDISLIAGPKGAIEGGVIAQSGAFELVSVGEFVGADAPLPDGCRLIGGFALA
jgi:chorismate mutase